MCMCRLPVDPLLCTFSMSLLSNTSDSNHQLIKEKIHELKQALGSGKGDIQIVSRRPGLKVTGLPEGHNFLFIGMKVVGRNVS